MTKWINQWIWQESKQGKSWKKISLNIFRNWKSSFQKILLKGTICSEKFTISYNYFCYDVFMKSNILKLWEYIFRVYILMVWISLEYFILIFFGVVWTPKGSSTFGEPERLWVMWSWCWSPAQAVSAQGQTQGGWPRERDTECRAPRQGRWEPGEYRLPAAAASLLCIVGT